jgi:hypothetical protein
MTILNGTLPLKGLDFGGHCREGNAQHVTAAINILRPRFSGNATSSDPAVGRLE